MENLIKSVKLNKPVFIKGFLSKYNVDINKLVSDLKDTTNADKHYYSNGVFLKNLDEYKFIGDIKKELNFDNNLIYKSKTRYWIHPKNNYTQNHYDGDGTNVINICIKGKKNLFCHHQIHKLIFHFLMYLY